MKRRSSTNFEFLMHMYNECFRFKAIAKISSVQRNRSFAYNDGDKLKKIQFEIIGEIEVYHYAYNYIVEFYIFSNEISSFKKLYNQLALYKKRSTELYVYAESFYVVEGDTVIYSPSFTEHNIHYLFEDANNGVVK